MFESAKSKLARGEYHIAEFKKQLENFSIEHPGRISAEQINQCLISAKPFNNTDSTILRVTLPREIPENILLTIGDAIHNIRVALDHITWSLVEWDGGKLGHNLDFPISHKDIADYQRVCAAIKTPSTWINDFFLGCNAYYQGLGEVYYWLNFIDNMDKHRRIIPVLRAANLPDIQTYNSNDTKSIFFRGNTINLGDDANGVICAIPYGGRAKIENGGLCSIELYFDKIDPNIPDYYIRTPIASVLSAFHWNGCYILGQVEKLIEQYPKV